MSPQHNKIVITEFDRRRLVGLMDMLRERSAIEHADIAILEDELERAEIVSPQDVPRDVVTMNSCVQLRDLDTHEELAFTLVFPGTADAKKQRISVLAPIGVALLGCREHEEVSWPTPSRVRRLRIERILYQPEASGNYEL